MTLSTGTTSPEIEIADQMVLILQANPLLQQPEIHVEHPVDIVRAVESLQAGHIMLDVWAFGIMQQKKNRRNDEYMFEVHLGVRVKVEEISKATISMLSYYRGIAQATFGVSQRIDCPETGVAAFLSESEPFAPYGRESLHSRGLFIAPIRFVWKALI